MRSPFTRSLAVSLALCAMLLRALLPDGWMPAAAGAAAPFVICSVDGVHMGGKAPAAPSREQSHAPCAFATAAPLAPPSFAALTLPAPSTVAQTTWRDSIHAAVFAESHRPNAARAPPAFS